MAKEVKIGSTKEEIKALVAERKKAKAEKAKAEK